MFVCVFYKNLKNASALRSWVTVLTYEACIHVDYAAVSVVWSWLAGWLARQSGLSLCSSDSEVDVIGSAGAGWTSAL